MPSLASEEAVTVDLPARRPPASAPGFDVEPTRPKGRGLSRSKKGLLGLALFAVLGLVGLLADVLAARDGQTPASGFDQLEDDGQASGAAGDGTPASDLDPDPQALGGGLADDPAETSEEPPRPSPSSPTGASTAS